jgi:hypothetical protein
MLINGWLNMRFLWLIATLVVITGCDPGAIKSVRLQVPALAGSGEPLQNPTVRDAVGIVDSVVERYGLHPDTNGLAHDTRTIRLYVPGPLYRPPPGATTLDCRVELAPELLEVLFVEFPKLRSSSNVVKMQKEIRTEFVNQFGKDNVQ